MPDGGAALAQAYSAEVVEPLLERLVPDLRFATARLGSGSDVLGYDDGTSRDHDWGLRLTVVVPDGRLCACGNRGCLEMYASGRALARDARELAADSPVAVARMLQLAGGITELDGPVVTQAAREGDPAALSLCTTMGRWLGRGLANLAAVLDPSMFVIGGGVSAAGELLLRPAREEFAHNLTGRGFRPVARIEPVALGPDAGLVGAADLARRAC